MGPPFESHGDTWLVAACHRVFYKDIVMWYDIMSVKEVKIPLRKEDETIMVRLGVRITLANGHTWFRHKKGTWSCRWPATRKLDRTNQPAKDPITGAPIMIPGQEFHFKNWAHLEREMSHCKILLQKLRRYE